MKRRTKRPVPLLACLLLALVLPGCSATAFNWVPGIEVAERISAAGTILAGPVAASDSSQQQDVLMLDTSIKRKVTCVRFPGAEYKKLQGKLVLGATVAVVYTGTPYATDFEMDCISPLRWEVRAKGNPTRRDFLIEQRNAVLLKALKGRPDTMRHFYGSDLGGFIAIVAEFPEMCETVVQAGAVDLVCPSS